MKDKLKINITSMLFFLMVLVFVLTISDKVGDSLSLYKYFALTVCTIFSFVIYNKKRKDIDICMRKEFSVFYTAIAIIVVISILQSIINQKFTFRTVQELIFLICPILYAFFFVNILNKEKIDKNMKISCIIIFIFYIISLRNVSISYILKSLTSANFLDSSSNLESSIYSGFSLAFCFYFCYYDNKFFKYLCLLFVFMTFKRISLLIAIGLFILSISKFKNKPINKKTFTVFYIILVIATILWYNCLLPKNINNIEIKYNIDFSKFTSTRSDRLYELMKSPYKSYGFGSSTDYMYENKFYGTLEMDFVKIIVELGYIPIFFMIYSYLYVGKKNLYLFFFMSSKIITMIFASSLTNSFTWLLFFISIATINKYSNGEVKKGENGYINSSSI